eukprot:ANDGO_01808.mRNA.1 Putative malate transporter YflS
MDDQEFEEHTPMLASRDDGDVDHDRVDESKLTNVDDDDDDDGSSSGGASLLSAMTGAGTVSSPSTLYSAPPASNTLFMTPPSTISMAAAGVRTAAARRPLWKSVLCTPFTKLVLCYVFAVLILLVPRPPSLSLAAWFCFGIFVSTILGFLLHPYPMGQVTVVSLCIAGFTHTLNSQQIFAGFGDSTVWLVVAAFLLSTAVEKTGLGRRIALTVMVKLGKSLLGLGLSFAVAEAFLALIVPSNTARGGGILAPIVFSLCNTMLQSVNDIEMQRTHTSEGGIKQPPGHAYGHGHEPGHGEAPGVQSVEPKTEQQWRSRAFLILCGAHCNLISAAYVLTGSAPNVLVSKAAKTELQIDFGWIEWLESSVLPALVSFFIVPIFLYALVAFLPAPGKLKGSSAAAPASPRTSASAVYQRAAMTHNAFGQFRKRISDSYLSSSDARNHAEQMLSQLGALSRKEKLLAMVFLILVLVWAVSGQVYSVDTAVAALAAVASLVFFGVLTWDDIIRQSSAFDCLIWLGGILSLAEGLSELGFLPWVAEQVFYFVRDLELASKVLTCVLLSVIYFYSMYSFSMITAHITCFVPLFMNVGRMLAVPPFLLTALLAHMSCLCACLTTFSSGPIIIYFGFKATSTSRWFAVGFLVSIVHCVVWLGVGLIWWKILGWY